MGWITSVDNNGGSTSGTPGVPDVQLNAKYDLNGNRTVLNSQVDALGGAGLKDDFQNAYAYDRIDRLTSVIQTAASTSGRYAVGYKKSTFAWDGDSRLTTFIDYKDSTAQAVEGDFSYDHASRLTALSWSGYGGGSGSGSGSGSSSGYFEQFSWTQVTALSNVVRTSENLSYTYDHDWQLTSAAGYGGYGGYGGGSWSWDGNGDSTLTGRVTGAGNRLLSDGTYHYEYDKSGHMTKRTAISGGAYTVYSWDNRGNLVTVTDYTSGNSVIQTVTLWYDAFNDLIGRTVATSSGTMTARFVYDLSSDSLPSPLGGEGPGVRGSGEAVLAFDGNESPHRPLRLGPGRR